MKKSIFLITAMAAVTLNVSAQKTTTVTIESQSTEARTTDAVATIHAMPMVCDVKVKTYFVVDDATGKPKVPEQKSKDLSWCVEDDFHTLDKTTSRFTDYWHLTEAQYRALDNPRNYAIYKSQQYHKCDAVLAAIYNKRSATENEKQNGIDYVLTVTGYAADFINFRLATEQNFEMLNKNFELIRSGAGGDVIVKTVKGKN